MAVPWQERTAEWLRRTADAIELGNTGVKTPQTRLWQELRFLVDVRRDQTNAVSESLTPLTWIAATDLLLGIAAGGDLAVQVLAAAKESNGKMFGDRIVKEFGSEGLPEETAGAVDRFLAKAALAGVQALRAERRRRAG